MDKREPAGAGPSGARLAFNYLPCQKEFRPVMSTRKSPPGGAKPAPGAQRPRHAVPIAQSKAKRKGGRDLFGLYFILGGAAFIFLFGAAVWGLRGLNSN